MRVLTSIVVSTAVAGAALTTAAQPKGKPVPKIVKDPPPPELVGLERLGVHAPERGFVDDPVAADGDRLAVIVTDGADLVEARVLGADGAPRATVSLAPIAPAVRRLYLRGDRLFVVADRDDGGPVAGTLVGLDAKVIKAYKPATDLFLRTIDGKDAVIVHNRTAAKKGTVHKVEAFDLVKGKPLGKRRGQLTLGADGRDAKLDFRPAYFVEDLTVAVGTKGGVWRKVENQRSPDTSAAYDLLTGRWVRDERIADVVEHARRLEVLVATDNPRDFVRFRDDLRAIERWRDGVPSAIALDQPLEVYEPASLGFAWRRDRLWIALKVDPVNAPAVARKKADPEYVDLFEVDGGKAVRRARLFAPKKKLRIGFAGDTLWVMDRNVGFDRGSKSIAFYAIR